MSIPAKAMYLLRELREADGSPMTVEKLAERICSGRSHVQQTLANTRTRGKTRARLMAALQAGWPDQCHPLFQELGWPVVPRGESRVEQPRKAHAA